MPKASTILSLLIRQRFLTLNVWSRLLMCNVTTSRL
ncbi:Uncharacterised protein [Vibrio cholerae]|nr:Uncharacterised protein [Vibrio cholerae]